MSRTYRRLVDAKATERFRHTNLEELAAAEFIKDIEFDKLDVQSILLKIQMNAERLISIERKLLFATLVLFSILYFSISGVRFNLNYLGISLSDFKSIKEVTIALILIMQSYIYINADSNNGIISIHRAIIRKTQGDNISKLIHAIEFPQDGFFSSIGLNIGRFRAGNGKLLLDTTVALVILINATVFTALYVIVIFRIQSDIWINSNLGSTAGHYFVVITTAAFAGDLFVGISRSFGKFRYIDNEKLDELHQKILTREDDSELIEMIREIRVNKSSKSKVRIMVVSLIIMSLMIVAWTYLFDASFFTSIIGR